VSALSEGGGGDENLLAGTRIQSLRMSGLLSGVPSSTSY
jgi:hypothetical protein